MHEGGVGDGAGLRIGRRGGPPVTRLLSLRKVGLGMCCRRHAVTSSTMASSSVPTATSACATLFAASFWILVRGTARAVPEHSAHYVPRPEDGGKSWANSLCLQRCRGAAAAGERPARGVRFAMRGSRRPALCSDGH